MKNIARPGARCTSTASSERYPCKRLYLHRLSPGFFLIFRRPGFHQNFEAVLSYTAFQRHLLGGRTIFFWILRCMASRQHCLLLITAVLLLSKRRSAGQIHQVAQQSVSVFLSSPSVFSFRLATTIA